MRAAALLAAVLLLVPLAAGQPAAEFSAATLQAQDPVTLTGPLRAFDVKGDDQHVIQGATLTIHAARAHAVANRHAASLTVAGFDYGYTNDTVELADLRDATLTTSAARPAFDLFLVPDPNSGGAATLDLAGGAARPAATARTQGRAYVDVAGRPALEATTEATIAWAANGRVHLHAEGDLTMAVWEWDLTATSQDGQATLRSGYQPNSAVAAGGANAVSRAVQDQVYLTLQGAVLDLEVPDASAASAWAAAFGLHTPGTVVFAAPAGDLAGTHLSSAPLSLHGLDAALTAPDGRLRATLDDMPSSASSGGQPISFGNAAVATGPSWAWPLAAVGLMAVPVGAATAHRVRLARWRARSELAMEAGAYEFVVAGAPRLLRARRHRLAARTMLVVALLRLGRGADARALLELGAWEGPLEPSRKYLLAHAYALQGDRAAAARLLSAAMAADPMLGGEAKANPVLRGMLGATGGPGYS